MVRILFSLFFLRLLNDLLHLHPGLSVLPSEATQSSLQVLTPIFTSCSYAFEGLVLLLEEGLRELVDILAVLKFSSSDLACLFEVAIFIE